MRWPRWRFTIRRFMALVAALALILGADLARRRALHFGALARSHAQQEEFDRFLLGGGTVVLRIDGKVIEAHGPQSTRIEAEGGGTLVYDTDPTPGYGALELQGRADRHASLEAQI